MHGRTAIVTGASRGIGLAIARELIGRGANVVITGRRPEGLVDAVEELGVADRVVPLAGNVADPEHRSSVVGETLSRFGRVDMLVNNAGINPQYGPLIEADLDAARKTIDTNVLASLAWTQDVYARWMRGHGGAVVNVASMAGLRAAPNIGAYAVSKAAVIRMTEQLAVELGPGIRVNAVAPAVVRTTFSAKLYENEAVVVAHYPLKRLGTPSDVATAVAFLLSDQAAWITGHTLAIDGGLLQTGGIDEGRHA